MSSTEPDRARITSSEDWRLRRRICPTMLASWCSLSLPSGTANPSPTPSALASPRMVTWGKNRASTNPATASGTANRNTCWRDCA